MSELNWNHLRSFVSLISNGSAVKAAESTGQTQPTVTRHLRELNHYFGKPVVRLSGRKLVATDLGKSLYDISQKQLNQLNLEIELLKAKAQEPSELTVNIGGRREILDRLAGEVEFPGSFRLFSHTGTKTVELLNQSELDIGITQRTLDHPNYVKTNFFEDEPVIVVPKAWRNVTIKENLPDHPFASYENQMQDLKIVVQDYINQKINFVSNDWSLIENQVHKGHSWSIIPSSFFDSNRGYKKVDFPFKKSTRVYIYYRKEFRKLSWFNDLLNEIRSSSKSIQTHP